MKFLAVNELADIITKGKIYSGTVLILNEHGAERIYVLFFGDHGYWIKVDANHFFRPA